MIHSPITPNPAADALGITELRNDLARLTAMVSQLMTDNRPPHYTDKQAAAVLGKSPRTISRMIARGELERTRDGIPREAIDAVKTQGANTG
jgi:excisionase family DNA binding protein